MPKIGWRFASKASQIDITKASHWRLQPPHDRQAAEFAEAFKKVRREGGWCLDIDEAYHVSDLGLEGQIVSALREGRSDDITVVSGIQRPSTRHLPREVWSEPTHIFAFMLTDGRDRTILRDQVGSDFARRVASLNRFHFVYVNTVTDEVREGTEYQLREVLGYPKEED